MPTVNVLVVLFLRLCKFLFGKDGEMNKWKSSQRKERCGEIKGGGVVRSGPASQLGSIRHSHCPTSLQPWPPSNRKIDYVLQSSGPPYSELMILYFFSLYILEPAGLNGTSRVEWNQSFTELALVQKQRSQCSLFFVLESEGISLSVMPTLCDSMDYSSPGSSVHGIFQARIQEWVAIPFSREYSWPKDQTWVSCIVGKLFTIWATREGPSLQISPFPSLSLFLNSLPPGLQWGSIIPPKVPADKIKHVPETWILKSSLENEKTWKVQRNSKLWSKNVVLWILQKPCPRGMGSCLTLKLA